MVARTKLSQAPKAAIFLAEWRETKFATQQELADAMGTTAATVSRVETGERDWSRGYLEALAYLVGCKVGDLFHHPDSVRNKPNLEELMRLVESFSEDQIATLISFFGKRDTTTAPREEPSVEDPQAPRAKAKSA